MLQTRGRLKNAPNQGRGRLVLQNIRHLAEFPDSKRIFQRNGKFYQPGEIFRQPELARTLERIAASPNDFYHGALASELAASIQSGGGLITKEDLAEYEVKERQPVRGTYRGYQILSAPPPSSGGVTLVEMLNILEGYDLAKLGNRSADSIHLTTEAMRRARQRRGPQEIRPRHDQTCMQQFAAC